MTASATSRIRSARPGRLAKALTARFANSARTEWDSEAERGSLIFASDNVGEVDMIVGDGVLLLHIESSPEHRDQLEAIVGTGVVDLGGEENLVVQWKHPGGGDGSRWVASG